MFTLCLPFPVESCRFRPGLGATDYGIVPEVNARMPDQISSEAVRALAYHQAQTFGGASTGFTTAAPQQARAAPDLMLPSSC
jgi:hypothetical protein